MSKYLELRNVDVSDKIDKKNGLSYLSWAWAVDTLLQHDPQATWSYGQPVLFGETVMVFRIYCSRPSVIWPGKPSGPAAWVTGLTEPVPWITSWQISSTIDLMRICDR